MADFRRIDNILIGVFERMTEPDDQTRRELQLADLRTALMYAELKLTAEPREPIRRAEVRRLREQISALIRERAA